MIDISQGVILVGGRGERLRPLTDNIPKPMVLVIGKPFLEHLILLLKENGIKKFLLLTGYLGNKIREYFEDGNKWGIKIDYSFEKEPLGTAGALRFARNKLEENFFLFFGDSYLPVDYKKIAYEFIQGGKKALVVVYDNSDDTEVPFNIMLDKSKKVVAAYNKGENNPGGFDYCDAGVIAVNKQVVSLIEGKDPLSFEESIYPRLIVEEKLGYYIAENRFYDIGTIERLETFGQYVLKKINV